MVGMQPGMGGPGMVQGIGAGGPVGPNAHAIGHMNQQAQIMHQQQVQASKLICLFASAQVFSFTYRHIISQSHTETESKHLSTMERTE